MLTFLLVLLAIYFVVRVFFRFLFPLIVAKWIQRKQESMGRRSGMFTEEEAARQKRRQGEVNIEYTPERKDFKGATPKAQGSEEEYVDFEEIETKKE